MVLSGKGIPFYKRAKVFGFNILRITLMCSWQADNSVFILLYFARCLAVNETPAVELRRVWRDRSFASNGSLMSRGCFVKKAIKIANVRGPEY